MAFANQLDFVIYLTEEGLQLYDGTPAPKILSLTEDVFLYQEIKDKIKLEKLLRDFFTPLQVAKKQAVLVISARLSYIKVISKPPVTEEVKREFLSTVPINPLQIYFLQLKINLGYALLAVNKEYTDSIRQVFEALGGRIRYAVPQALFGNIGQSGNLTPDDQRLITGKEHLLSYGNFLSENVRTAAPLSETFTPIQRPLVPAETWMDKVGSLLPGNAGANLGEPAQPATPGLSRQPGDASAHKTAGGSSAAKSKKRLVLMIGGMVVLVACWVIIIKIIF